MNKMKSKFILISMVAVCLFFTMQIFAVTISTSTRFRARAVPIDPEINIVHTPITMVSPIAKEMVVVGSIDAGSAPNYLSELKLVYTLPGGTETTENINFSTNVGNITFSKRITFLQESGQIEYKIMASVVKGVSVSTETSKYYAVISGSITVNIGSSGGTITLESGNQLYGNTTLVCGSGALSSPTDITITEVDINQAATVYGLSKATAQEIMLTCFDVTPDISLNNSAVLTLYYGSQTTSQNVIIKRFDGSQWVDVVDAPVGTSAKTIARAAVVNTSSRTASVEITQLGRYATFAGSGTLPDNAYRPVKKVVVFGRAQVEFNNLMDGDVVKIFNVNGKKIREITTGDAAGFKWDGKKDDGSYAESGAYIYQIKLAEKGNLISGTIAFVR
ncbi:MAG: FlgD immunoglobulin-like domain containing protein [Endomicrobiaceae bacterium]|nr:FlgD immunoglobulin-like domain containing protein [Endomicrobiaceae bacterium]